MELVCYLFERERFQKSATIQTISNSTNNNLKKNKVKYVVLGLTTMLKEYEKRRDTTVQIIMLRCVSNVLKYSTYRKHE